MLVQIHSVVDQRIYVFNSILASLLDASSIYHAAWKSLRSGYNSYKTRTHWGRVRQHKATSHMHHVSDLPRVSLLESNLAKRDQEQRDLTTSAATGWASDPDIHICFIMAGSSNIYRIRRLLGRRQGHLESQDISWSIQEWYQIRRWYLSFFNTVTSL